MPDVREAQVDSRRPSAGRPTRHRRLPGGAGGRLHDNHFPQVVPLRLQRGRERGRGGQLRPPNVDGVWGEAQEVRM